MQVTEKMRLDSEAAYRLIGEVVLMLAAGLETKRLRVAEIFRTELDIHDIWSPETNDVMRIVIDKLEILPTRGIR